MGEHKGSIVGRRGVERVYPFHEGFPTDDGVVEALKDPQPTQLGAGEVSSKTCTKQNTRFIFRRESFWGETREVRTSFKFGGE